MACMAYSSVFSTPLPMFTQAKLQWGSDSSFIPFLKASSNFVSSKSVFFQLGFSIQSSNITGLVSILSCGLCQSCHREVYSWLHCKGKKNSHSLSIFSLYVCVVDIQLCFLWVLITIFVWCVLLNLVVHLMTVY